MISTIYCATNKLNGKPYIGFDSSWPKRKYNHIKSAFNPKHTAYNYIFHRALRKYNPDSFIWSILYQSNDPKHTLEVKEEQFIRENNTHYIDGHGYNMTYGGNGSFGPKSTEARAKISASHLGVPLSESHILAKSKDFIITFPDGKEVTIRNLSRFCRSQGLSQGAMSMVAKGSWEQHKGFRCRHFETVSTNAHPA